MTQILFLSLRLNAVQERWELATEQPDWIDDIGPVAVHIFELLPHTPVTVFGINLVEDFQISAAENKRILQRWAPLDALGRLAGQEPTPRASVHAVWEGYRVLLTVTGSRRLSRYREDRPPRKPNGIPRARLARFRGESPAPFGRYTVSGA
jgi:hypothetical protein